MGRKTKSMNLKKFFFFLCCLETQLYFLNDSLPVYTVKRFSAAVNDLISHLVSYYYFVFYFLLLLNWRRTSSCWYWERCGLDRVGLFF